MNLNEKVEELTQRICRDYFTVTPQSSWHLMEMSELALREMAAWCYEDAKEDCDSSADSLTKPPTDRINRMIADGYRRAAYKLQVKAQEAKR